MKSLILFWTLKIVDVLFVIFTYQKLSKWTLRILQKKEIKITMFFAAGMESGLPSDGEN